MSTQVGIWSKTQNLSTQFVNDHLFQWPYVFFVSNSRYALHNECFGQIPDKRGCAILKSDNLQYNMLVHWDKWLVNQASDVLRIVFFILSSRLRALKSLYFCFYFCKFRKKIETIFAKNLARNYKKK